MNELIYITNSKLDFPGPNIIYINDNFIKKTGYTVDEIIGKTPRILQGKNTNRETLKRMKKCLLNNEYFEGDIINYNKNGDEYHMLWAITPINNNNGFISTQKEMPTNLDNNDIINELEKLKELNSKILSNIDNYLNLQKKTNEILSLFCQK